MEKLELAPRLIFSGREEDFYHSIFSISIDKRILNFNYSDLDDNQFIKLQDKLPPDDFLRIKNESGISLKNDLFPIYLGNSGFPVYYCILKPKILILVSFNEKQPLIYDLYIEGAWELD